MLIPSTLEIFTIFLSYSCLDIFVAQQLWLFIQQTDSLSRTNADFITIPCVFQLLEVLTFKLLAIIMSEKASNSSRKQFESN